VGTMQETFIKLKDDIQDIEVTNAKVAEKYNEIDAALKSMDKGIDSNDINHVKKIKGTLTKLHMQCFELEERRHKYFRWLTSTSCNVEITLDGISDTGNKEENPDS